jgi:hypothetical protein
VLVAADATWNWWERLRLLSMSLNINSAIGERQMLPKQINSTFTIKSPFSAFLNIFFKSSHILLLESRKFGVNLG